MTKGIWDIAWADIHCRWMSQWRQFGKGHTTVYDLWTYNLCCKVCPPLLNIHDIFTKWRTKRRMRYCTKKKQRKKNNAQILSDPSQSSILSDECLRLDRPAKVGIPDVGEASLPGCRSICRPVREGDKEVAMRSQNQSLPLWYQKRALKSSLHVRRPGPVAEWRMYFTTPLWPRKEPAEKRVDM